MRLSFCSVIIPQYQNIPVVIDDSLSLKKFLPKISSETFNSRVACSPAVLYWSWWITAWFTVCVSRNTASKPQTALWGAPYGAFFLAIFTEEEWVLIEKGLLEYFQQPLYRTFLFKLSYLNTKAFRKRLRITLSRPISSNSFRNAKIQAFSTKVMLSASISPYLQRSSSGIILFSVFSNTLDPLFTASAFSLSGRPFL